MHDVPLITTIAGCATAALLFGLLAKKCGLSPLVGYLLAGIAVGPHTPGFVGDEKLAAQLAEIGVMLMMFGVGIHFHLKDLAGVKGVALPGAIGQSAAATLACMALALLAGWSMSGAVVLGVAVSVASTVVLLRCLGDHALVETPEGKTAVGWLLVEDIFTVIILVLLPPMAAPGGDAGGLWQTLALAMGKLAIFMALMLLAGAKLVPLMLQRVAALRSPELFTLAVLVLAVAVATLAAHFFGASMALGAFLAGMVVGQSRVSHQAAADLLPMRDAFAVLFFVSVGMLFDFRVLLYAPLMVLGVTFIILVIKPAAALLIVLLRKGSLRTALTVAAGLAQIGEFSFIVGGMAVKLDLMPQQGLDVLVAGAMISISLNPVYFRWLLAQEPNLRRWPKLSNWLARQEAARAGALQAAAPEQGADAVVIGYGPVGRTVTQLLRECGVSTVVVETNMDTVAQLQASGQPALYGDASRREILEAAGLRTAEYLVITIPRSAASIGVLHTAKLINSRARILCRAGYLHELEPLEEAGAEVIRCDEAESATALAKAVLQELDMPPDRIAEAVRSVRSDLEAPRIP